MTKRESTDDEFRRAWLEADVGFTIEDIDGWIDAAHEGALMAFPGGAIFVPTERRA